MYTFRHSDINEFKFYYGEESLYSFLGKALTSNKAKYYTVLKDNVYIMDFYIFDDKELGFNPNLKYKNCILYSPILKELIKYLKDEYDELEIILVQHLKDVEVVDFDKKLESLQKNGFKIIEEYNEENGHVLRLKI